MALSEKGKQSPKGKGRSAAGEINQPDLPYRIELCHDDRFERVLALAAHAGLARAIFSAAKSEHPERIIILSRGDRVIARSADE
jgi:hypothetical protein